METKEIKIVPPKGYEIDKEQSSFDCIKFKPTIKKWRDDTNAKFNGWYISSGAEIIDINDMFNTRTAYNVFVTRKQAKSALAMARISQIMVNDKRFGGPIPDEDWADHDMPKYCIIRYYEKISREIRYNTYCFLAFHTREQRDSFLEENEDLVKDYLML